MLILTQDNQKLITLVRKRLPVLLGNRVGNAQLVQQRVLLLTHQFAIPIVRRHER